MTAADHAGARSWGALILAAAALGFAIAAWRRSRTSAGHSITIETPSLATTIERLRRRVDRELTETSAGNASVSSGPAR